MTKRFQQAIQLMRRHDPQAKEDGFHLLLPHVAEHIDELIAEFAQERDDHGLRCWLLELIGQARLPRALSVLAEQLHSDDESLRYWAVKGLEQLGTIINRHGKNCGRHEPMALSTDPPTA